MKNKARSIVIILTLAFIGIGGLLYANDLKQKNTETVFLTSAGIANYSLFKQEFEEKEIVVLKKETTDMAAFETQTTLLRGICKDRCQVFSSKDFPKSFDSLFKLEDPKSRSLILIGREHGALKGLLEQIESSAYWGTVGKGLHLSGVPFTNILLDKYSKKIKEVVFPALFTGIFLCFVFMLRNLKRALILFFPCVLSAALSLSTIKFFFVNSNLITAIVPLMMFVINVSTVLHIFYTAKELGSVKLALDHKKQPIFLMITTTFIGFLSLYFSALQAISTFGLLSASLIVCSSLLTLLWLYHIDRVSPLHFKQNQEKQNSKSFLYSFFQNSMSFRSITLMTVVALITGFTLYQEIPVITDATKYFPKKSLLRESMNNVSRSVLGTPIVELIIDSPLDQDFSIALLKKLDQAEKRLKSGLVAINKDIKVMSLNTLVKKVNLSYAGAEEIPEHMLAYSTLRSKIPTEIKEGLPIERKYRMTIFSPPVDIEEYDAILNQIKKVLAKDYEYTLNGLYFQLMMAQREMISTLFYSFALSLFVISLLAFLTFKSIKLFFIFMFVNIIPVLLSFLFLYLFKLSFNIATVMTYCISLGLIVDSSFHIIHALKDPNTKYAYYFKTVVTPIINGSLVLSFCFISFALNDFLPIREFGICLSIVILIGMFFDLKVLPTLFLEKSRLSCDDKIES